MAPDKGLEELLRENLAETAGLTQKAMFGGMAWPVNGNLLCGASDGGMLVRLGKDNDAGVEDSRHYAHGYARPQDERVG